MKKSLLLAGGLALLIVTFAGSLGSASAATTAFVGATVHTVAGSSIENATVLVEDGKIAAIGSDVDVPADAAVMDVDGLHLYPGFVHPLSVLGLTEISSVRGTRDYSEVGDVNSNIRAEVAFNADSELLPVALSAGILTAHIAPTGGVFRGTSAVMQLEGWNWEDMTVAAGVGAHIAYPRVRAGGGGFGPPPSEEEVKERKEKALKTINDTLDDAEAYAKAVAASLEGKAPKPDYDAKLASLGPVLSGEMPVFLYASERSQIESALDWADERGLDNLILVTGADSAYLAERLAEEGVKVLLNGVLERPERDWEPYDTAYTAAKRLHEAGVQFAIGDGGSAFDAAHVRNLPFHAAMAASFGLPKDAALRSVTLSSAELLGVADRVGSLEIGKDATFIATNGDPLEIKTQILGAWIQGEKIDFSLDRQKRLYEKYDNRPRPEAGEPEVEGIKEEGKG